MRRTLTAVPLLLLQLAACCTAAIQFHYVGCYPDPAVPRRDLDGLVGTTALGVLKVTSGCVGKSSLTQEYCAEICWLNGFPYFGAQIGRECYCGHSYGNMGPNETDASCSTACGGNAYQKCGAVFKNSVFAIELGSSDLYQLFKGNLTEVEFNGAWSDDMASGFRTVSADSRVDCLHQCIAKANCRSVVYSLAGRVCHLMRLRGVMKDSNVLGGDAELWLP